MLSGSGPTVLALCRDATEAAMAKGLADTGVGAGGYTPYELSVDLAGTTCAAPASPREPGF